MGNIKRETQQFNNTDRSNFKHVQQKILMKINNLNKRNETGTKIEEKNFLLTC